MIRIMIMIVTIVIITLSQKKKNLRAVGNGGWRIRINHLNIMIPVLINDVMQYVTKSTT